MLISTSARGRAGSAEQRGDLIVAHRRGIERYCQRTGRFDAPDRVVDEACEPGVHVRLVEENANHRYFGA